MARLNVEQATERALGTFDRLAVKLERIYGLDLTAFDGVPSETRADEMLVGNGLRGVRDSLAYVFPHWSAFGLFVRLPIGTFALFLAMHEPWETIPSLTATIVLGNQEWMHDRDLAASIVDPERRAALGAWYEMTAQFDEDGEVPWRHGFYARKDDPHRNRLDKIWRRHRDLLCRKPTHLQGDFLLTDLWERVLSRPRF